VGGVNLAGVVLDDDAEDELGAALERARKLRQAAIKNSGETGVEQVCITTFSLKPLVSFVIYF
jgi:hypothetical protein